MQVQDTPKRGSILNLIGPPGVGKSTFASKFVLEHPYFKYCSIDAYKVENWDHALCASQNERLAWKALYQDIHSSRNAIIESVGLDWRLKKTLGHLSKHKRTTIAFVGDAQVIEKQLRERQHKRPVPMKYNFQDEIDTVYHVLEQLEKNPEYADYTVNVTGLTPAEVYEIVTVFINNLRVHQVGR